MGCVVNANLRPLDSREIDPVPIEQVLGGPPGPFWTDAVNLVHTRIRSPDRSARSGLSYCVPLPATSLYERGVAKRFKPHALRAVGGGMRGYLSMAD
jgi:hypothetical protein